MIKKYITEHSFVKRGKRIYTISVGVLPPEQVEAYMKVVKERIMAGFNSGGLTHMVFTNTNPI